MPELQTQHSGAKAGALKYYKTLINDPMKKHQTKFISILNHLTSLIATWYFQFVEQNLTKSTMLLSILNFSKSIQKNLS